ncbi:MAG TPA: CvpA family protein [Anaerovoracaceae bacterium]|nr:CvpA family protein [Anaerovoracaceae bacterium]
MWVDAIIVSILVYGVIQGFRRGFVRTFLHAAGWILSVVLGFVWYPHVIGFLKENTGYYDTIRGKIAERIAENAAGVTDSALTGIPEVIRDLLDNAINSLTGAIADTLSVSLTNLIFNIIGFLTVVIAIKIIFMFITLLFSKEKRGGVIGGMDGFLGLFAGALKGILIVYILLALMVPVLSLSGSTFLTDQLDGSVLGSYLYDNNLILMAAKGLLGGA